MNAAERPAVPGHTPETAKNLTTYCGCAGCRGLSPRDAPTENELLWEVAEAARALSLSPAPYATLATWERLDRALDVLAYTLTQMPNVVGPQVER